MKTFLTVALFCVNLVIARADTYLPIADGTLIPSATYIDSVYIMTGTGYEGDLQFASFNSSSYSSIQLELNPYGEPLYGNPVYVYGFDNASGQLSLSDFNVGTYLGAWVLPAGLGYGQETFFDVTAFVHSVTGSFFGFELQSSNTDQFCTTSLNYGTPPELIATGVPEPLPSTLMGLAIVVLAIVAKYRQQWHFTAHLHN